MRGRRVTYANVVSTLALFAALGGGSYAAVTLPAGSVGSKQIHAGAVTASKLAFALASSGSTVSNGPALMVPAKCSTGESCSPPASVSLATTDVKVSRSANVLVIGTATFMDFGPAGDAADVRLNASSRNIDLGGGGSGTALAGHPVSITYQGFARRAAPGRYSVRLSAFSTGNVGRVMPVNISLAAIALPAH